MKNIEKSSGIYFILFTIAVAICGLILYPLFDLILCKFITNSEFNYSIHNHVIQPILFAWIVGFTDWIFDKKRK